MDQYTDDFWHVMKLHPEAEDKLATGKFMDADAYILPSIDMTDMKKYLTKESLPRKLCSVVPATGIGYDIFAHTDKGECRWVKEGDQLPLYNGMNDFTKIRIGSKKLTTIVRFDDDFVKDAMFPFREQLVKTFARMTGKAEEEGFILGDGDREPSGIAAKADVALSTKALTYDDVLKLYFSLDPEYRENGTFLMNDKTALALRTMKDAGGNYLWREDGVLGKPVVISNFMPDDTPVLFGDFKYYWWIDRRPFAVKMLSELFAETSQMGYLGIEYVDGVLTRTDAVKSIKVK